LSETSTAFLKLILSKFLESANNATPPRPAFGGATPQQNFLLQFSDFARPFFQLRKKKILFRRSALIGQAEAVWRSPKIAACP